MPQMLWMLHFLKAQGCKIKNDVLHKDNKSSILLETNARGPSGKPTRHIDVGCFFVADQVKSGEIRIEHCPTGVMIADHFTKALQGALFHKLRDMIMGNTDVPSPSDMIRDIPDPSVGIPDGPTLPESRSVLKDETAVGASPCSLTVLPAFGSQVCQSVPTGTGAKNCVADKKALSWAETVKKQRVDDTHSFYEIPNLTIELINW
jgi:hypothetical protein